MSMVHAATDSESLPTLTDITQAQAQIRPFVPPTPSYSWPSLNHRAGCEIWFKHENHTALGAFKIRGGLVYLAELLRLVANVPGLIAASTGNHGQSVAFAAAQAGLPATIVVPCGNNPEKNQAMRALGAAVVEHGREFQESLEHSRVLADQTGCHFVPSFHPWLVRGVATYALEFFQAAPALDVVYVPIGLGSGICGVAAARNALGLGTRIVGVVSDLAPAYALSFHQRRVVTQPSHTRVSEGVACSTPVPLALRWIWENVHDVVTIGDEETRVAIREILVGTHNLVEGAGAIAWAAARKMSGRHTGLRVGCVISGGNASLSLLREVLATEDPSRV